jgi:hypothetical protein
MPELRCAHFRIKARIMKMSAALSTEALACVAVRWKTIACYKFMTLEICKFACRATGIELWW